MHSPEYKSTGRNFKSDCTDTGQVEYMETEITDTIEIQPVKRPIKSSFKQMVASARGKATNNAKLSKEKLLKT